MQEKKNTFIFFIFCHTVRRQDSDSRGPTPTLENGLADSTNVTPSESTISVVSTGVGRYEETPGRLRCRDFDGKFKNSSMNENSRLVDIDIL